VKSGKSSTQSKDSLLRQFFDCTELEELHVLSVTTPGTLDSKLNLRLRRIMRQFNEDKRYCMILRNEMGRILYTFNKNHGSVT
jgi:hypothetical protein